MSDQPSRDETAQPAYGKIAWSWRPKLAPSLVVVRRSYRIGRASDPQGDGGNRARLTGEIAA